MDNNNVIFEYSLFNQLHDEEPEPEGEGETITMKAVFEGANSHKRFEIHITRLIGPPGMKVKAIGDYPPHQISEALVSYLVKRADECGETMLNAMGEVMFSCCLDYATRYYVKLPYVPDSTEPTRFFIQPCGRGYKRHWHLIPLDDITKQPLDLAATLEDHTIPSLGAALEQVGGHIFKGFEDDTPERSIESMAKRMIAEILDKDPDDITVINAQGKELEDIKKEIDNMINPKKDKDTQRPGEPDPNDWMRSLWDAPTVEKRNTDIIDDE